MIEFDYTDKRVLHTLSTYISEGYLFPDIIKTDCKFRLITPKIIHKYKFLWSNRTTKVKCCFITKTIIVPRHINNKRTNTKLESILNFGFHIFNLMANRELFKQDPIKYIKLRFFKKQNNFAINKRLIIFFDMLKKANSEFIAAYNDYHDHKSTQDEFDKIYIKYQSHIFLVSTLFELYHPFERL